MNQRKIVGTVGALQFEVIQYRMKGEYGASCDYEPVNLYKAFWVTCDDKKAYDEFYDRRRRDMAMDKHGSPVFLAESAWALQMAQEQHPKVQFHLKSDF
jgi:peptide chain release factor 3